MTGHCVDCKRNDRELFLEMFCPNKKMNIGVCEDTEDCEKVQQSFTTVEVEQYNVKTTRPNDEHRKECESLKSQINHAISVEQRLRDRELECRTNSNGISAKDNWVEYSYQIKLQKELEKILGDKALPNSKSVVEKS